MLIKSNYNILQAWLITSQKFALIFIYTFLVSYIDDALDLELYSLSNSSLAIIATGVTIFLGFRINSAYGRWWEARQIWGEMVNICRNFGSCTAVFSDKNNKPLQREVVYNLIGFINATRLHLRKQSEADWQNELWHYRINKTSLFSEQEVQHLTAKKNKPTQILHLMSDKLSQMADSEYTKVYLNQLLQPFYNCLGKCERIKNTTFPWGYSFYTLRFVWVLTLLIPFALLKEFNFFNVLECTLASTLFVTAEQVGRNLDSPFEHSFNDTPMSTLCKSIEIDLLEQLGEKEIPSPLTAKKGILF